MKMYYKIKDYIETDKKLSGIESSVLINVSNYAQKGRSFYASSIWISNKLNISTRTLYRVLSKLDNIGYIVRKKIRKGRYVFVSPDCPHYHPKKHTTYEKFMKRLHNKTREEMNNLRFQMGLTTVAGLIKLFTFKAVGKGNSLYRRSLTMGDKKRGYTQPTHIINTNKELKTDLLMHHPPPSPRNSFFFSSVEEKLLRKTEIEQRELIKIETKRLLKNRQGLPIDYKIDELIYSVLLSYKNGKSSNISYLINGGLKLMEEGKWRIPYGYVPPDAEQMTKNENNHIDEHNKRKQEDLDMCRRSSEVIDNEGNTNNKATYKSAASILSFRRH